MARKGFHLSTLVLALSFGGVLIVAALFAVSSFFSAQKLIKHQIELSFDYRHRIIQISLDEKLKRASSRLSTLSLSGSLINAVQKQDQVAIEENLFSLLQNEDTQDLDSLLLTGEKGLLIGDVSSALSPLNAIKEELISHSSQAFESWTLVEMKTVGDPVTALIFSVPVIEPELGRVIGAVHAAISVSQNIRLVNELQEAADVAGLMILLNDKIIAYGTDNDQSKMLDTFNNEGKTIAQIGAFVAAKNNLQIKQIGNLQLSIFTFMKGDNATSLFEVYSRSALLLIVGALVTALAIAYLVRRLMSVSSDRLLSYVEDVSQGESNEKYIIGPVNEFNHLGEVVGDMVSTIQENERYLTNLIELANSPILAWDENGEITKFNQAAERIFGFSQKQISVQKLMGAINVSIEGERTVLEQSISGIVVDNWEMVISNPKTLQDHYMSWSISPVAFHEDGTVATVLAQGQDMTHRKMAEEELHRVNEELELRVMHRPRAL